MASLIPAKGCQKGLEPGEAPLQDLHSTQAPSPGISGPDSPAGAFKDLEDREKMKGHEPKRTRKRKEREKKRQPEKVGKGKRKGQGKAKGEAKGKKEVSSTGAFGLSYRLQKLPSPSCPGTNWHLSCMNGVL